MPPNPRRANGHRRRQLTARVWAEETTCALCGRWVDKTLGIMPGVHSRRCRRGDCQGCVPDPMRGEVDEDIPVSRGGSPYDRANCHLMHRECNRWKSNRTLAEARQALTTLRQGKPPAKPQRTAVTARAFQARRARQTGKQP